MGEEVSGNRYLLDTIAVNIILDHNAIDDVRGMPLYVTTTQIKELAQTTREERRELLLASVNVLGADPIDARSAHWCDADWDQAVWSDEDDLCSLVYAEIVRLDAASKKKKPPRNPFNQQRDAETIETAIKEHMIFVTSDANAAEACRKFGGRTIRTEDLIAGVRATLR